MLDERKNSLSASREQAVQLALELRRDRGIGPSASLVRWAADAASGHIDTVEMSSGMLHALAKPLRKGTVTLLSGLKGTSKSFFVLQQALHWHSLGVPFACRFLEDEQSVYLARMLSQLDGADWTDPEKVRAAPEAFTEAYQRHRDTLDGIADAIEADNRGLPGYDELLSWVAERVEQHCRVLVIDPISIADSGAEPWRADKWFMCEAKRIIGQKASLLLVTHPRRDGKGLAGGEAFPRLAHNIFELSANPEKRAMWVRNRYGTTERVVPDRVMLIDKARNGPGTGCRVAMRFDPQSLRFSDLGVVVPKPKDAAECDEPETEGSAGW